MVVVTFSPGDTLETFLASLALATRREVEVVVADNGSTDGAPEAAARTHPNVTLRRTGGNVGYGRAANAGAEGATTPWLVVANPDVTWRPGSLDAMLDAADAWPGGGSFGPSIHTPAGGLYPSARALPSLTRGIGHAVFGWCWPTNPWTRAYRRESGPPQPGPVGWLSGACLVLRRQAFESVGGFDPRFFMYFEDLDLCERLGTSGWQNVYLPDAVVEHSGGHASARAPRRMLYAHHVSAYKFLAQHHPGPAYAPLRAVLALGLAARFVLSLLVPKIGAGAVPTRDAV